MRGASLAGLLSSRQAGTPGTPASLPWFSMSRQGCVWSEARLGGHRCDPWKPGQGEGKWGRSLVPRDASVLRSSAPVPSQGETPVIAADCPLLQAYSASQEQPGHQRGLSPPSLASPEPSSPRCPKRPTYWHLLRPVNEDLHSPSQCTLNTLTSKACQISCGGTSYVTN